MCSSSNQSLTNYSTTTTIRNSIWLLLIYVLVYACCGFARRSCMFCGVGKFLFQCLHISIRGQSCTHDCNMNQSCKVWIRVVKRVHVHVNIAHAQIPRSCDISRSVSSRTDSIRTFITLLHTLANASDCDVTWICNACEPTDAYIQIIHHYIHSIPSPNFKASCGHDCSGFVTVAEMR